MKAVIYARYSSDSQREESIEGQLRECTEYAERNGITILRSYIDRALSARTADRPEFQNMIKDSEQKLFDVVLIWKLDRFSRDRYDSAHYKRILKKNGVKVIVVLAKKRESTNIFRLVKAIDPNAFISQSAVIGVFGEGFDKIKVK